MDLITKLRYQGFLNTSPLWKNESVSQFKQIQLSSNYKVLDDSIVFKNQRLGKLVEEFVFHQLKQQNSIIWICDNLQIQRGKQTIGEIDALYYQDNKPIHLEVVYKFYLYDTLKNYSKPLDYWIGPNRKDSLLYKLNKLNTKQFPLLKNELTTVYLKKHNIDLNIEQKACFKAQLFLPYHDRNIDVNPLNPNCVKGFYISYKEVELLKKFEFYIPKKLDWLIIPHNDVEWRNYTFNLPLIEDIINEKRSPLVWLKDSNAMFTKCFITFW